jgi:hypothetical protein
MRAPGPSFADAIDEFRHRYGLLEEDPFFDRVRQCTGMPRARHANDYKKLTASLVVAWSIASVWPRRVEIERRRREDASRKRDAVRTLREDDVLLDLFDPAVKKYLDQRERLYAMCAEDPGEILDLEWVDDLDLDLPRRHDDLTFAELGRERRSAGPRLFVREVSAAMRAIFSKPHDKIVGVLAGLAFETKPLKVETVRTMRKETGLTRKK